SRAPSEPENAPTPVGTSLGAMALKATAEVEAASPADEALAGRSLGTSAIPPARLVADERAHLTGRSWHGMIFANFANMYALTFLGATRGAAPTGKPTVVCEDKRNDCHQYVGRGPLGNGCNQHSDYMRVHCARSCGRCDDGASEDELAVSTVTLGQGGLTAKMLSARGVRRWEFMELPVQEPSSSLECSEAAAADGQCQAVRLSNRSHVVAAHFYDSQSHHLNSTVYRWSPVSAGFEPHQALATVGAWGLTSFRLGDAWYLAVASYFDGGTRELNSTVFKWDASLDAFGRHQEMQITGATDVEFLPLGTGEAGVLAFAGHKGTGVAPGGECQLFLWDGRRFNLFQIVETSGAYDVEGLSSQGGNEVSFIVVHDDGADIFAASRASLLSGEPSPGFTLTQSLGISHGRDAEHFELDGGRYLVLSVFRNESSYEVESLIYKWDAREGLFLEMQRLPSEGAFDAELLRGGPEPLLMVSSQRSGVSRLYRLGGAEPGSSSFVLQGKLSIPRVYNVAWQCIPEAQECYLGVASYDPGELSISDPAVQLHISNACDREVSGSAGKRPLLDEQEPEKKDISQHQAAAPVTTPPQLPATKRRKLGGARLLSETSLVGFSPQGTGGPCLQAARLGFSDLEPPLARNAAGSCVGFGQGRQIAELIFDGEPPLPVERILWAPEMYSANYGLKVDIWAMGVVMYGLLDGRFPFKDEHDIKTKEPKYSRRLHPVCQDFISLMLRKNELERGSADDVMAHGWLSESTERQGGVDISTQARTDTKNDDDDIFLCLEEVHGGVVERRRELVERLEDQHAQGPTTASFAHRASLGEFLVPDRRLAGAFCQYQWWDEAEVFSAGLLGIGVGVERTLSEVSRDFDRSPHIVGQLLKDHNIDITQFGVGEAKTLEQLASEVQSGSARLMLDATCHRKLVRVVDVVLLRLFSGRDEGSPLLIETGEQYPDGRR
ncbi:unnamed protein product, partial [Polarella glacialis]